MFSGGRSTTLRRYSVCFQVLCPVELSSGMAKTTATQQQTYILLKRSSKDGVEEGVTEGVDWVEEDEEDLGVGDGDEGHVETRRDGKEGDGCHAEEVGEDEDGHALGDPGVAVAGCQVGVVDGHVDTYVAAADDEEGSDVEEEEGYNIHLRGQGLDVHGQADRHLEENQI